MDLVNLYPPIGIIVDGLMIGLIANHYIKTRYRPGLFLLLHYIIFVIDHILWIPISTLGIDQFELARNIMIGTIFVVLSVPCFTIAFFESTKNKPFNLILIIFVLYFFFLLGYSFSINWVFGFERIWRYQISGTPLILFIIPFAATVIYLFIRLCQILFNFPKGASLKLQWKFGKRSKILVFIWTVGLLFRYLSMLLIATVGVTEFNFIIRIGSVITIALVFLYDPSSFFLSNAQIKSFLIFNAESGILLYSMGGVQDDLKASGLFGASILEREISGASSLPHILMFADRVILIEYQKIRETLLAATMIVDRFNPIFQPTLKHGLHQFIKMFDAELANWQGNQQLFNDFTKKAIQIFGYAYHEVNENISY